MFWSKKEKKESTARMSALFFAVFAIILITASVLLLQQREFDKGNVRIGEDILIDVDVAATAQTLERGLSGRKNLENDEGMLFLFATKQRYVFWMKGMRIPIDILWIDEGRVVDISAEVPVPGPDGYLATYRPSVPVDTVLEVPAGFVELNGVTIGVVVAYEIDR